MEMKRQQPFSHLFTVLPLHRMHMRSNVFEELS